MTIAPSRRRLNKPQPGAFSRALRGLNCFRERRMIAAFSFSRPARAHCSFCGSAFRQSSPPMPLVFCAAKQLAFAPADYAAAVSFSRPARTHCSFCGSAFRRTSPPTPLFFSCGCQRIITTPRRHCRGVFFFPSRMHFATHFMAAHSCGIPHLCRRFFYATASGLSPPRLHRSVFFFHVSEKKRG